MSAWRDTFWHRGLLYAGSWGSAETCMAMWEYQPGIVRGAAILGAAFVADFAAHIVSRMTAAT